MSYSEYGAGIVAFDTLAQTPSYDTISMYHEVDETNFEPTSDADFERLSNPAIPRAETELLQSQIDALQEELTKYYLELQ